MRTLLISLIVLFSIPTAHAQSRVRACVLDGGGDINGRACGVERATSQIQGAYRGMHASTDLTVLTGSGQVGQPACQAPVYGCVASNCAPDAIGYDTWNASTGTMVRRSRMASAPLQFTPPPPGHVAAGTSDSFDRNCLFDSAHPPSPPIPVCHFWSVNHGEPAGVDFYNPNPGTPDPTLSTDRLAQKAAGCGTFRFMTQSCYSAQLGKIIYDQNGRVIPGRCGLSASPPGFQAQGALATDSHDPQISVDSHREGFGGRDIRTGATGRPGHIFYPLMEQANEYMNATASPPPRARAGHGAPPPATPASGFAVQPYEHNLDGLYSDSMRTSSFTPPGQGSNGTAVSLAALSPYQTSDYYLEHELHNELGLTQSTSNTLLAPYERQRGELINRVVAPHQTEIDGLLRTCNNPNNPFPQIDNLVTTLDPVIGTGLSADEKAMMEYDLRREAQNLIVMRKMSCIATSQGLGLDMTCDMEARDRQYQTNRTRILAEYQTAADAAARERTTLESQCSRAGVRPCADLAAYSRRVRTMFTGSPFCHDTVMQGQAGNGHLSTGCTSDSRLTQAIERYNALVDQRARTVELERTAAQKGTEVENFLQANAGFRRYETAKMRFAQVVQLYRTGSTEKVRDYLTLRRCEIGDFDKPAPTDWASLRAQRHVP